MRADAPCCPGSAAPRRRGSCRTGTRRSRRRFVLERQVPRVRRRVVAVVGRRAGDAVVADLAHVARVADVQQPQALAVPGRAERRPLDLEVVRRAPERPGSPSPACRGTGGTCPAPASGTAPPASTAAPARRPSESVRSEKHDLAAVLARPREVLLRADEHVAPPDALGAHRAVGRPARVVHEHHGLRRAGHAAAGDEDRVERRRPAVAVLVRVAVPAARRVAADTAAAADPGDARGRPRRRRGSSPCSRRCATGRSAGRRPRVRRDP